MRLREKVEVAVGEDDDRLARSSSSLRDASESRSSRNHGPAPLGRTAKRDLEGKYGREEQA